jgi:hypothetical protein
MATVGTADVGLQLHALNRVDRHAHALRHVLLGVTRTKENLDLVASKQGQHLS